MNANEKDFLIDWRGGLVVLKKQTQAPDIKEQEKPVEFKCRLCGCTEYKGVFGDSCLVPLGGRMYPFAYQCCGCSVMFTNMEKFTIAGKEEK